ncbi:NAD(P)-binding protein [Clavulina sp. PMI_390]|nr:NAD(P)-binding protein [Clavulina sp. PMI_390]
MAKKVFLITGTSSGFGAELVKVVLEHGDIAVATSRDTSRLDFTAQGANSENYLAIPLDVTNKASIQAAFDQTLKTFGKVDVVINNAGYGAIGVFESLSEAEIQKLMAVNFFGVVDVTRTAMEIMRGQPTGGVIQQMSSISGRLAYPGYSMYNASKWALEGFTEAISKEVKPEWNIKFQLIEPGRFRTDWGGPSLALADNHPGYPHMDLKKYHEDIRGREPDDPVKGALEIYKLANMENPPLRCILGANAYNSMIRTLDERKQEVEKNKSISFSTAFDST